MQKKIIGVFVFIVLAVLMTTGCSLLEKEARADGNSFSTVGNVEATEVDVRSKIPGRIMKLHVDEGQDVEKGQLLFQIDPKDLEIKKMQAEAVVMAAEAQLYKAINGARDQEIKAVKALVEKAEAKVELLEKKHDRLLPLYEAGAVARDKIDELETELTAAGLDVVAAREQYELALEGARVEDIRALEAQYAGAMAQLEEVLVNLEETEVKAPMDGNVSLIICEEGELVGSATPVITLTNYADSWVELNIDELQIGKVEVGQQVKIKSKAYPDKLFNGKVISIKKNPDFATKRSTNELNDQDVISYGVKVKLAARDEQLYPGMLVDVLFNEVGNDNA